MTSCKGKFLAPHFSTHLSGLLSNIEDMKKPRTTHTSFYKGSKIRIIFRTGEVVIAKFKEKLGQRALRTDKGDYLISDIRSCNYYKPLPHEIV